MPKTANVPKGKAAMKKKLKKFRVVEGHHYHGDKVWSKGEVIKTALDLDKMFQNKFERMPDEMPSVAGMDKADFKIEQKGLETSPGVDMAARKQVSQNPEEDETDDLVPDEEGVQDGLHQFLQGSADVTEMFPFVMEEARGLRVLQNGAKFGIVEESNPRELLNADGPLKKGEVEKFVEKFLDDE